MGGERRFGAQGIWAISGSRQLAFSHPPLRALGDTHGPAEAVLVNVPGEGEEEVEVGGVGIQG